MSYDLSLNFALLDATAKYKLVNCISKTEFRDHIYMLVTAKNLIQNAVPTDHQARSVFIYNTQWTCLDLKQSPKIRLIQWTFDLVIQSDNQSQRFLPQLICNSNSIFQCLISVEGKIGLKTVQSKICNLTFPTPPSANSSIFHGWDIQCEFNKKHPVQFSTAILSLHTPSKKMPEISTTLAMIRIANIILIPPEQAFARTIKFSTPILINQTDWSVIKQGKNLFFEETLDQSDPLHTFTFQLHPQTTSTIILNYAQNTILIKENYNNGNPKISAIHVTRRHDGKILMNTAHMLTSIK